MAKAEFLLPKMGESITEATIITWLKKVGDLIEEDEVLLEIATDKVDSELPSPFSGKVLKLLYKDGDVVAVGSVLAIIETDETYPSKKETQEEIYPENQQGKIVNDIGQKVKLEEKSIEREARPSNSKRFYSPLIRNIAQIEGLSIADLDLIKGTGNNDRVTKTDIENFVRSKNRILNKNEIKYTPYGKPYSDIEAPYNDDNVEIIEMDRMRRVIADHMVRSKRTSPHVTSFLEIDVSNIVEWRERVKNQFEDKYGYKITYTPIFIEAVTKAIVDFPGINASVDGYKIILKKYINMGVATATPSGNLIVPVIKNVDRLNLTEIAERVSDLSTRARQGKLIPDEIQGGTFTLTNVGTFGNTMGTPIINQPQVAILSTGAIRKKPAVIESDTGDKIEIRKFMFLSLSYDHRIVDGALGGRFLRRVGDYLENFDGVRII